MARRKKKRSDHIHGLLSQVARPFRRRAPPGSQPGLVEVPSGAVAPQVRLIVFSADAIHEERVTDYRVLDQLCTRGDYFWLDVDGLGDAALIRKIGELFHLHSLALEDVMHVHQRAKVEDYGKQLFIVARMPTYESRLETEQLSLFVSDRYVITFQEGRPGDCLEPVRQRLRSQHGLMRHRGPDYLAYAILDAVIDSYFPIIEGFGDRLNELDEQLSDLSSRVPLADVHRVRSELLLVRRAVWPHREAMNHLLRETTPLITAETRVYLRDCYDHILQIIDVIETYREMCSDLRDFQISLAGQRANEIMKVLTIISTIFIPLSFVAGIYGMNFEHMPELKWRYGYFACLAVMGLIGMMLVGYIWRRGWFR